MIRLDLLTLLLSMLLSSLGTSIMNIALPSIVQDLNISLADAQWLVLSYLLSNSMFIVIIGKFSDLTNKKNLFLLGLALFSFSNYIAFFTSNIWLLVSFRAVQGIGSAILMTLSTVLLSDYSKENNLSKYMGLIGTMSALGTASGPVAGGLLISLFGWKSIFALMALLGTIIFFLFNSYFKFADSKQHTSFTKFDFFSGVLLAFTILVFILTLNRLYIFDIKLLLVMFFLLTALIFSVIRREQQVQFPLVGIALLNQNNLKFYLLLNFIVAMIVSSTLVVGPFFLSKALNLNYLNTGLAMSASPIVSILSGLFISHLNIDHKKAFFIGLVVVFFGTVSYVLLPIYFGVIGFILSAIVLSPGYQLFQATNNTILMSTAPSIKKGAVSSLNNLARNLGLMCGTTFSSIIFTWGVGSANLNKAQASDILTGTKFSFLAALVLSIISIYISFTYLRPSQNKLNSVANSMRD